MRIEKRRCVTDSKNPLTDRAVFISSVCPLVNFGFTDTKPLRNGPEIRNKEKSTMSTKEIQEKIVLNMTRWQRIEDAAVASTGRVIEKTSNPIVRLVMEIIQRDSQMHHRVQELIVDSLQGKAVTMSPDDLGDAWELIEKHIQLERQTVELAELALEALKGTKMGVQQYLIEYLLEDERKHNVILEKLASVKKGMYP